MNENPRLSKEFLDWITQQNCSEKVILEIGAGKSTTFFSKFFKEVYTFEDNLEWFENVKTDIKNTNATNINLFFLEKENVFKKEFKDIIKKSDYFLIDNQPNNVTKLTRFDFAKLFHTYKNPDSIIILDNGEWNLDAYEYLRNRYYCIDFPRMQDDMMTETTIFFKLRRNNKTERTFL